MTMNRKIMFSIGAILLTGVVIAIPSTKQFKGAYAAWQKEREQARVAAEKAYFQEHVEGFLPADWRAGSWVQIERGGWKLHTQCKWTSADSRYRSKNYRARDRVARARFEWSDPVTLSPTGDRAIEDALNIIVRDELWKQQDIIPPQILPDSMRTTVEFQVGPHTGRFKFYDLPRENLKLRQFLHKLKVWQADVEARVQAPDHDVSLIGD